MSLSVRAFEITVALLKHPVPRPKRIRLFGCGLKIVGSKANQRSAGHAAIAQVWQLRAALLQHAAAIGVDAFAVPVASPDPTSDTRSDWRSACFALCARLNGCHEPRHRAFAAENERYNHGNLRQEPPFTENRLIAAAPAALAPVRCSIGARSPGRCFRILERGTPCAVLRGRLLASPPSATETIMQGPTTHRRQLDLFERKPRDAGQKRSDAAKQAEALNRGKASRHPDARQSEFPVSRGGLHQESHHNKHNR